MYTDHRPCDVCGSEVRLRAKSPDDIPEPDGPVGPAQGFVGGGDDTIDQRVCTNPEGPTNKDGGSP